jgi:hypoxanthine-guanine phosphoribosyltransferase
MATNNIVKPPDLKGDLYITADFEKDPNRTGLEFTRPEYQIAYTEEEILAGCVKLAEELAPWIEEHGYENLVLCPLLNGGINFCKLLSDELNKRFWAPATIIPLHIQSYLENNSQDRIKVLTPLPDLSEKSVLLVDDIKDRGNSFEYLRAQLPLANGNSEILGIRTCSLVSRIRGESISIPFRKESDPSSPDYAIFYHAGDEWMVGLGMNDGAKEETRQMRNITVKLGDVENMPLFQGGLPTDWTEFLNTVPLAAYSERFFSPNLSPFDSFFYTALVNNSWGTKTNLSFYEGSNALFAWENQVEALRKLYCEGYSIVDARAPRPEIRDRIKFLAESTQKIFNDLPAYIDHPQGNLVSAEIIMFYGGFCRGRIAPKDLDGMVVCSVGNESLKRNSDLEQAAKLGVEKILNELANKYSHLFNNIQQRLNAHNVNFAYNVNTGFEPQYNDLINPHKLPWVSGPMFFRAKDPSKTSCVFMPDSGDALFAFRSDKKLI